MLLTRTARTGILDISSAKCVLQELHRMVAGLPSLVVQPVIIATQEEPGMFDFYRGTPRVLPTYYYNSSGQLIANVGERVTGPAEAKVRELRV